MRMSHIHNKSYLLKGYTMVFACFLLFLFQHIIVVRVKHNCINISVTFYLNTKYIYNC